MLLDETQSNIPKPRRLPRQWLGTLQSILPGLLFVGALVLASQAIRTLPTLAVFSPMIVATLLGMIIQNTVGTAALLHPGIKFSAKILLRAAIVLLGLRLTVQDLAVLDPVTIALIAALLASTLAGTIWLGGVLGVDKGLAQLIAVGTAICGASAIAAANVMARAKEEDVAYALICVTLYGTVAMFAYPVLATWLGLEPLVFAIWAGASIHEVAQVVGTAFQLGQEAGELGTLTKLVRVLMLAPALLALGVYLRRGKTASSDAGPAPAIPGFILLYLLVILLNSLLDVPQVIERGGLMLSEIFMTMALAALGLGADFSKLRIRGWRPLLLGGLGTLYIAGAGLGLVVLLK